MKKILIPAILVATILVGGVMAYAIFSAPQSAQDYFKKGKEAYDQQKYADSIVQLLNVVQQEPRNRDARYFLALSYLNQNNMNAGAQQLASLLDYYPDDIEANLRLGNLYLAAGGTNADFFKKADELAKKVLAKDAQNVSALLLAGNASAALRDYRASVELLEKAVS